ncbi:AsmA family protein [Rhodomicrobium sp. Az07]|uniref:AsmA family protein n=1 Tax=Rhodomicrobium sp. Az07 TaxID=2839034 RepID=UPI001BE52043|nr:AsmA family protein [Rhodomicrobium sp. Az07]MBT3070903.1 AsmA family protein [Rhodomicrobium sp. Az07]
MGRFLATFATLLVLLIGAAFTVPAFLDWNAFRPDIEEAASTLFGQKIRIVGDIDIALLPEPHVRAAKIATDPAPGDKLALSAEALDLSLSLQGLIGGHVEASRLKLVRPVVIVQAARRGAGRASESTAGIAFPFPADVRSLEVEGGSFTFVPEHGAPLTLSGIDGKIAAPTRGAPYRASVKATFDDRRFDVRLMAQLAQGSGIKLSGSATDLASKAVMHADGVLRVSFAPTFEGSLTFNAPKTAGLFLPVYMQASARAKIDLDSAALSDLALTLDGANRPQIFAGRATIPFAHGAPAEIFLQGKSLDADALLAKANPAAGWAVSAPKRWDETRAVVDRLLWLYPEMPVRLELAAEHVQLKDDFIDGVKLEGTRDGNIWTFSNAAATLPGDTALAFAGTLARDGGKPELAGKLSIDARHLARLNRWMAPEAGGKNPLARAIAFTGQLKLSETVAALESLSGTIEGAPFTGGIRLDSQPIRKLSLTLAGDRFILAGADAGQDTDAFSTDALKSAWQGTLAQLAPFFGEDLSDIQTGDIGLSAGELHAGVIHAKNLAAQIRFTPALVTVTKLSAETLDGLSVQGEGVVPLKAEAQGRFEGRVEARTPEAVAQAAAALGMAPDRLGARTRMMAPAALTINYGAETRGKGGAGQITGTLGDVRVDGRAQIKGNLADWRTTPFTAQLGASSADGIKLLALLYPKAAPASSPPPSTGTLNLRLGGTYRHFDTSGTLKTQPFQAQIDGATDIKGEQPSFSGKVSATAPSPEQFLSAPLLALLGADTKAPLHVEATVTATPERIEATKLKAESGRNAINGTLAAILAEQLGIEASLSADQLSLPSLLGQFLAPLGRESAPSDQAPLWSERPFNKIAFEETSARIALGVRSLKLSDGFALSDAQVSAILDNGRLDIRKLDGKALGGTVSGSLVLDGKGPAVVATANIALTNADLSLLPAQGTPPLMKGRASLVVKASGQALSPRGLVAVLGGKGAIAFSEGQLAKLSPAAVQKSGDDMQAAAAPLAEEAIARKVQDALQSGDFKFRKLRFPLVIRDGTLEIPRASFRNPRDGTVRMRGDLDLATMQADTTWQLGVTSDRRKWPPVKVVIAGPLRELGAARRSVAAEDFVRAVLVRKMEKDIARLESLNRQQPPQPAPSALPQPAATPAASSWTTAQEPTLARPRRKTDSVADQQPAVAPTRQPSGPTEFEKRFRDLLAPQGAR